MLLFTQGFIYAMQKTFWVSTQYLRTLKEVVAIHIIPETTVSDIKKLLKKEFNMPYARQTISLLIGVIAGTKLWPIEGKSLGNKVIIKDAMNEHITNVFNVPLTSEN